MSIAMFERKRERERERLCFFFVAFNMLQTRFERIERPLQRYPGYFSSSKQQNLSAGFGTELVLSEIRKPGLKECWH